jgi:hypothetical protein
MTRLRHVPAVALAALALAGSALGATTYAGPQKWYAGQGAGSSFSSRWSLNDFAKVSSGYDTTVTFIDNIRYSWHATVRNTSQVTHTAYWGPEVRKGHCRANVGGFWGSCIVAG